MAYGSFGELLGAAPAVSASSNPYMPSYAGYAYDVESGKYHTLYRHLDPATGRWLTKDPIGFDANDTNLYRYVFNSSTNLTDPFGLDVYVVTTLAVGGFHKKIVVDTPSGPFAISFGMADPNAEMQGSTDTSGVQPGNGTPGSGVVYIDRDAAISETRRLSTSRAEDQIVLKYLSSLVGRTGPYNVLTNNCRNFSDREFDTVSTMIQELRKLKP